MEQTSEGSTREETHPREARGRISESVGVILALAMLMALFYVVQVGWQHFVVNTFVAASRDVAWMAPLSAAFFSLFVLGPVWLFAPYLARDRARAAAIFGGTWLLVFAMLLPWTQVHRLAAAALAAGVATAAVRTFSSTSRIAALRRIGLASFVLMMLAAGTIASAQWWHISRGFASLPEPHAGAPNVLFILLDTVRASAMSLHGYERSTTPEIDRLAAGGTVFDRAISTAPWTLPAHASLFTGEYPGLLSVSFRSPLDDRQPTLAEHFRDAGYETVGFTGNLHYTGWDSGLTRGFLRWEDFVRNVTQTLRSGWIGQSRFALQLMHARVRWQVGQAFRQPEFWVVPKPGGEERNAADMVDAVLRWQGERASRPYFAFINFFDAHEDYRPPADLRTRFAPEPTRRDLHDAEIFYIDRELGRLLRDLETRGALANTIVVITSDHGEQFGEHKMSGHGNSLYMQLLHVPLVVRYDGQVPAGRRIDREVSLRDVGATLIQLAALPNAKSFAGTSLAGLWSGDTLPSWQPSEAVSELTQDAPPPSSDPLGRSQGVSLALEGAHLIHRNVKNAKPEFFDIVRDPEEATNLAATPEGQRRMLGHRQRLSEVLARDAARFAARDTSDVVARRSGADKP
ncbi:MAG: sulfatase [Gemmatimonadaceae bacterium]